MGFRNPLLSLVQTTIPAAGIIGLIEGSQLAAEAINGMTIDGATITGGLFRTAAAGVRWELDSVAANELRAYTGAPFEQAPGGVSILYDEMVLLGSTKVSSPELTALKTSFLDLSTDAYGFTHALIHADDITLEGQVIDRGRQCGRVTFPPATIAAGGFTWLVVTPPVSFAGVPVVTVSLQNAPAGSVYLVPRLAGSLNADSFRIYLYNTGPGPATYADTVQVGWIGQG